MRKFKELRERYRPQEDLYHVTMYSSLYAIVSSGKLLPRASQFNKGSGNFGSMLGEYSKGRIHFSMDLDYWLSNFTFMEESYVCVLRLSEKYVDKYRIKSTRHAMAHRYDKEALRTSYGGDENLGQDLFVTRPVPLNHLEIYNYETGRWVPMDRLKRSFSPDLDALDYKEKDITQDGYGVHSENSNLFDV